MDIQKEHFCRFHVYYYKINGSYKAGEKMGCLTSRLAYIVHGNCRMETSNGSLELKPGDVWYVPKNIPYVSHWETNDYVEFYYFKFEADYISHDYIKPQKIENLPIKQLFADLYKEFTDNNTFGSLHLFYKILDIVTPKLENQPHNSAEKILPALKFININYTAPIKIDSLAKLCYLSPSRFYSIFKNATGFSPIEYKNNVKLSHAVQLLQSGHTLETVCETLSFSSPSFLRRLLKKHYGFLPKEIKKNINNL